MCRSTRPSTPDDVDVRTDSGRPRHVVIAGGGPTGLTLANLLGMYGIECLLLERHAATVHEPRAVSIDDEARSLPDGTSTMSWRRSFPPDAR